ncbi:MAG: mechanosensitive ion channel [Agathobacter sp.]|nr:mechanosensitive ion channel [Agathobacter sp.]
MIESYIKPVILGIMGFVGQVLIALLILVVGLKLISWLVKKIKASMEKTGKLEAGVISFLSSLIKYALYFILVMIILGQFGVTTSSVVAVLGSAGVAIGLALQGSLANFAGGVLILLLKPFVVGDYIVEHGSGREGTVSEISIFYTKLVTPDNRVIMIPNGTLSNSSITNNTKLEKRRLDMVVGVSYDADLALVKQVLSDIIAKEELVLKEDAKDVYVNELADSSVNMGISVWVKTSDYMGAKRRITENIKLTFDEKGISIPFPQTDVHISQEK